MVKNDEFKEVDVVFKKSAYFCSKVPYDDVRLQRIVLRRSNSIVMLLQYSDCEI